ncbi:MAG: 4Fe-4S binding protein [Candidatus Peregrinibacteria bacterium]
MPSENAIKARKNATIRRTMEMKNSKAPDFAGKNSWQNIPTGAVIPEAGNAEKYITGNWVPKKLIFDQSSCINCGLCWPVCPDDSIILDEKGNMVGIDFEHCKDCGMCIEACPTKPKSLRFEDSPPREI